MAVQVSYPGVYIEEFTPGAPIEGVGTSMAAFVGLAQRGKIKKPEKITSWDRFQELYGKQPVSSSYLWYAVRGFFNNGGRVCYVVRASNGDYAKGTLKNRASTPEDLINIRTLQPGISTGNPVSVAVSLVHLIKPVTSKLYRPTGNTVAAINGRDAKLSDAKEAAKFRPNDPILLGNKKARIVRVDKDTLQLDRIVNLTGPVSVRLDDLPKGESTVRIQTGGQLDPGILVPGTVLTISQNGNEDTQVVETVHAEFLHTGTTQQEVTYRVTLRQGLEISLDMTANARVQSQEINIVVTQNGSSTTYANLGLDPVHPNYFINAVNEKDATVELELVEPLPVATLPESLPRAETVILTGGADQDLATINAQDYIDALDTLRAIDDVNLIAVPDATSLALAEAAAVQQAVISHCEQTADRFAVLDVRPGLGPFGAGSVEEQRLGLDSTRGYAALYYPWLRVFPADSGGPILVPPSGHVCGIIARSDQLRGVHKAPANEIVNGTVGIERTMSDIDQGLLNQQGINVIRVFKGGRPILWGARTTATDTNWQYVNIRRLFLFLEESIQEGIRWAVFEPNNLQLWQKLKRTITEFLTRVWRDGALFGETAEDAFYVRIDEVLNPDSVRALGRLYIEIGVRPSYPAEFIIVRIGIWQGGAEISES